MLPRSWNTSNTASSEIFNFINNNLTLTLPSFPLLASISLPLGAMLGDMLASFIKRRIGHSRGEPLIGVDQLDFVMGAWILTLILFCILVSGIQVLNIEYKTQQIKQDGRDEYGKRK